MGLKLSDLQQVVKKTLQEKKNSDSFCDEIKRAFGPSVVVSDRLESLAEAANDHLDVLEYKGRLNLVNFSHKVAERMVGHESSEVRKLVARLLPESSVSTLLFDKNESVRLAAAKKAPISLLEKATKKFPRDAVLQEMFQSRVISESENALESSATDKNVDMLSEEWYENVARKLIQDYGRTLDTTWKGSAVKNFCSSTRATTRLPVDAQKLMEKVNGMLEDYEKARAKELGANLKESLDRQGLSLLESLEDEIDPIEELVKESLTPQEFIDRCNDVFEVKFATLPNAIMKYKIREGLSLQKVPVSCVLPHGSAPRRIDEVALDSYVKHWNDKQKLMGEPFKLKWDLHPESINKISFKMELK